MDKIRKLSAARKGSVGDAQADADLAQMGYKGELPRNLSMLSVLGLYGRSLPHLLSHFPLPAPASAH